MNILALDTSSSACSVALLKGDELIEKHVLLENQHSKFLLEFIYTLIRQFDLELKHLDAIAVGNGPGSFTGLRLGMGVAQGLAFGINKPLIAISSLQAIANTSSADSIFVAVDARMGDVYWQCFQLNEDQELVALAPVKLDRPETICLNNDEVFWEGLGSGFDQYAAQLCGHLKKADNWVEGAYPKASSIIQLAQAQIRKAGMPADHTALPIYVRDKVTD